MSKFPYTFLLCLLNNFLASVLSKPAGSTGIHGYDYGERNIKLKIMFQTKEEFFIKNILTIFFIFLGLILLCIFIFLCRSLLSMNSTILKSLSEVGKSLGNLKSCVGHLTKRGEGKRKGNFCVPNGAEPAGG